MIRRSKRGLGERATAALERSLQPEDPSASRQSAEALHRLERAIAQLPSPTREIFLALRCDGQSYVQIAEARGLGVADVEQHVARALLAISSAIEGDEERPRRRWRSLICRLFS